MFVFSFSSLIGCLEFIFFVFGKDVARSTRCRSTISYIVVQMCCVVAVLIAGWNRFGIQLPTRLGRVHIYCHRLSSADMVSEVFKPTPMG